MTNYTPHLTYLAEQERHMVQLTYDWGRINSGSYHLEGLARMAQALADNFLWLGGTQEFIDLPPMETMNKKGEIESRPLGQALRIRKRPEAPLQIFLGGHMDTVFAKDHPFQDVRFFDSIPDGSSDHPVLRSSEAEWPPYMNGPGVTDLKGGLVVMLKALEALEHSPWAEKIGWEVLINPDEEIGSPGSRHLFKEAASRNHLGLIFEPSLPEGTLVSTRKGSGNFALAIHGRAAHAGRDYGAGRSAIVALADAIRALDALNDETSGVIVNCGLVEGGTTLNTVPDLAILRFNVRVNTIEQQHAAEQRINKVVTELNARDGFHAHLHGSFGRAPKILTERIQNLQAAIGECGTMLGISIGWQPSGGVCDGNNLAEHGLPNIDTMGVRGGNIHSDQEYLVLESLLERARLTALLLMRLTSEDLAWPR